MAGSLPIRRIRPICPIRLIRLTVSDLPLSLQKAVFQPAKGGLLHDERQSFATQKAAYRIYAARLPHCGSPTADRLSLIFLCKNTIFLVI